MKKNIIYLLLLIIIGSCTGINQGNFNKRKYLNLKLKPTYTSENSGSQNDSTIDLVSGYIEDNSSIFSNHENEIVPNNSALTNGNSSIPVTSEQNISSHSAEDNIAIQPARNKSIESIEIKRHATKSISNLSHEKGKSGLLYFSILLAVPLMLKSKKGKRISKWASKNVKKAQVLIGLLGLTGIGSSYAIGNILQLDINAPMITAPIVLGAIAVGIYKYKGSRKKKYIKDRLSFALFNIAIFFGSFAAGSIANYTFFSVFSTTPSGTALDPGDTAFYITLLIIILIGSLVGLFFLACTISCMWTEALGVLALFIGSVVAIVFTILAIRAIINKTKGKTENQKKHNKPIIANIILQTILIGLGLINYFVWL